MDEEIIHSIYDPSDGLIYKVQVTRREAAALDNDHKRQFQLIKKLKNAKELVPSERWAPAVDDSVSDGSVWAPPAQASKGRKKGVCRGNGEKVSWSKDNAIAFIEVSLRFQRRLKQRVPDAAVWVEISTELAKRGVFYGVDELKEKLRNLKSSFKSAKSTWYLYGLMSRLLNESLEKEEASLNSSASFFRGVPKGFHSSPKDGITEKDCVAGPEGEEEDDMAAPLDLHTSGALFQQECMLSDSSFVCHMPPLRCDENNARGANRNISSDLCCDEEFQMDFLNLSVGSCEAISSDVTNDLREASLRMNFVIAPRSDRSHCGQSLKSTTATDIPDDIHVKSVVLDIPESSMNPHPTSVVQVDNSLLNWSDEELPDFTHNPPVVANTESSNTYQTPSKKKSKQNDNTAVNKVCTPSKSPKKKTAMPYNSPHKTTSSRNTPSKVSKKELILTKACTHDLLKECLNFKDKVQKEKVSPATWKVISANLSKKGHQNTRWQVCASKYEHMNTFFKDTMLPLKGMLGNKKWDYYDYFLGLHDVPDDYAPPIQVGTQEGGKLWTEPNVLFLLSEYKKRIRSFEGSGSAVRHSLLYAEIAEQLTTNQVTVTAKQCKDHMDTMKSTFRSEFDKQNKTGAAPSKWRYYDIMLNMYEGMPNLNAPVTVSVGEGDGIFTHDGEKMVEDNRKTRTRKFVPPINIDKTNKGRKGPAAQKNQLLERNLESVDNMSDEIRQLREAYMARSEQRLELMKDLLAKLSKD